ncbi:hypothetical protein Gasu2_28320 [Galdieria sulphuraria]|uniref:Transcription factor n=1 Tax=Galdieria sulphuraria TaxID=130081 RepID=M2XY50_GALSU|nr:transcription factor [Galdieria sulphuraria]EME28578.1 transcription factor [Galdieria sulphuraria]GJD08537.1 hypothetical protein Gasu2_28320 [Galdieria sulphuraria]|eukprot:XP_005705098.1 transcription factor [Galdieria sulphuraria]
MTKRGSSKLTIETISPYFTQNIQAASKELGICCTLLKKVCRKYGITRWPYRKIQSVEKTIQQIKERIMFLEAHLTKDTSGSIHVEVQKLRRELVELERKRQALLRPDKALINPYNLQPNYRLPFYWGADGMLPQVPFNSRIDQIGLPRDNDYSVSWEFPSVDDSPSCSEQTLSTHVETVETKAPVKYTTQRDDSEALTKTHMQPMSLEDDRKDIGYSESFPSEDPFPFFYRDKRESNSFVVSNDAALRMTNNDQLSRSSVNQTCGNSSFEEPSLHHFLSSPNNSNLDHLLADSTVGDFLGLKRSRAENLFDCSSSLSQALVRRRSASSISGGEKRRGEEFVLESRRRLSLAEEMMLGRASDVETFPQEERFPNWETRKNENDIQSTLFGLFQRMDQLEQENFRLRNNLNHLVARIPNPHENEQLY